MSEALVAQGDPVGTDLVHDAAHAQLDADVEGHALRTGAPQPVREGELSTFSAGEVLRDRTHLLLLMVRESALEVVEDSLESHADHSRRGARASLLPTEIGPQGGDIPLRCRSQQASLLPADSVGIKRDQTTSFAGSVSSGTAHRFGGIHEGRDD